MNAFITLIEVNLLLALFYACYHYVLSKETTFQLNRGYLLTSLFLSIIIPIGIFPVYVAVEPEVYGLLPNVIIENQITAINKSNSYAWFSKSNFISFVGIMYLLGAFYMTLNFIKSMVSLRKLLRKATYTKQGSIYYTSIDNTLTFSFFNRVNINKEHINNEMIRLHEEIHVKQFHSLDVLLVELFKIIFWYNPFIYLYKQRIIENHEFIADSSVVKKEDKDNYLQHIVHQALGVNLSLTNTFINPKIIKKRINMLKKTTNNAVSFSKYGIAIVLGLGLSFVFSCTNENSTNNNDKLIKLPDSQIIADSNIYYVDEKGDTSLIHVGDLNDLPKIKETKIDYENSKLEYIDENGNKTIVNVSGMSKKELEELNLLLKTESTSPYYIDGQEELVNFFSQNMKYPKEAEEKGLEGKVYVQFIVNTAGSIENIEIVKGVSKALDEEALRVVKTIPGKWNPAIKDGKKVNAKMTLPISFELNNKKNKTTLEVITEGRTIVKLMKKNQSTKKMEILFEDENGKNLDYINSNVISLDELIKKLRTSEIIMYYKNKE